MMVVVGFSPWWQAERNARRGATLERRCTQRTSFNRRSATVLVALDRGLKPTAAIAVSLRDATAPRVEVPAGKSGEPAKFIGIKSNW